MFDLFVLRQAAQRRVKGQFEAQAKARATVAATVQDDRRSVRRTASHRPCVSAPSPIDEFARG
jgi:hypothetical protein